MEQFQNNTANGYERLGAGVPDHISAWFLERTHDIRFALEQQRAAIEATGTGPDIDLRRRWLSEMPVCYALPRIPLPYGFHKHHGNVIAPNMSGYLDHWYGVFGQSLLCVTFGQFAPGFRDLAQPGERAKYFISQAPELCLLNETLGLAVMYGKQREIYQKTGMVYN